MRLTLEQGTVYRLKLRDKPSTRFTFRGEIPKFDGIIYHRIEKGYDEFEFQKGQLEQIEIGDLSSITLLNLE